jgi:hypothetical protein
MLKKALSKHLHLVSGGGPLVGPARRPPKGSGGFGDVKCPLLVAIPCTTTLISDGLSGVTTQWAERLEWLRLPSEVCRWKWWEVATGGFYCGLT